MKIHKNIIVETLFENYKRTIHLFVDRRLGACACFELNGADLKQQSSFVGTGN
jgi:hypothetical protein